MDKQAILNVDPDTVGRYAIGGLLAGSSAAALVDLIHHAKELNKERLARRNENKPDENTIVLTLPSKRAECKGEKTEPHKIKLHSSSRVVSRLMKESTGKQARHYNGEYGSKMAAHGWPTLTAATLAALGSGAVGAALVDKLYQIRKEKEVQKELDLAKQEYMSALSGKMASSELDNLFTVLPQEKTAGDGNSFGAISYPLAAAAILSIMGTAGTGYLTKKILDAKFDEAEEQGRDIPKVKRIIFQSQPETDSTKMAPPEDHEAVKAAFALTLDYVAGRKDYVGTADTRALLKEAGIDGEALLKMAATDADDTVAFLKQHPNLVNNLTGKLYADNRVKRFLAQTSPGRHMAIHRIGKMVERITPSEKRAQTAGAGGFGGATGGNAGAAPRKIFRKQRKSLTPPWMKSAQELPAHIAASKVIDRLNAPSTQEIATAVADEQKKREKDELTSGLTEPDNIRIEAHGAAAEKYMNANQKRIVKLIKRMAAEGQL